RRYRYSWARRLHWNADRGGARRAAAVAAAANGRNLVLLHHLRIDGRARVHRRDHRTVLNAYAAVLWSVRLRLLEGAACRGGRANTLDGGLARSASRNACLLGLGFREQAARGGLLLHRLLQLLERAHF